MKRKDRKGFTLAELLVVVAIIAVLVAIAIPIFTSQLEKSREATDAANIRSQYAEVMTDAITNSNGDVNANHDKYAAIDLKQTKNDWQSTELGTNLNSLFGTDHIIGDGPNKGGIAWVSYDAKDNCAVLHYEGGKGSSDSGNTGGESNNAGSGTGTGGKTDTPQFTGKGIDWDTDIKPLNSYTIEVGKVYSWNGNIYIGARTDTYDKQDMSVKNPDIYSTYYSLCKYTGKTYDISHFTNWDSPCTRGDICKNGDDYYIFNDGGNASWGPLNSQDANRWIKIDFSK